MKPHRPAKLLQKNLTTIRQASILINGIRNAIQGAKGEKPMKDVQEQEVAQMNMKRIREGAFLVVQAHDRKNVMTIGWAMFGYIWQRSTMLVAVRNSRFTYGIIEEADSFSVSIPTGNMQKEINFCGSRSGKNFDKFKECHFGTIKSEKVSSPLLEIPGYHYQCRIIYKTPMDPRFLANALEQIYPAKDYHTLYFGEITACSLIE
jgi:flavin reductase (DIM6/NTAB) family NADH-FMN oxidoreductase RutF